MVAISSIAVDADNEIWDRLVVSFKNSAFYSNLLEHHFGDTLFEYMLINLNLFLEINIVEVHRTSFKSATENNDIDCRHYSTYMMILFSKLVKQYNYPWQATIQQISGDRLNSNFFRTHNNSHAWNFVTVIAGNATHYWLYDPVNFELIYLRPDIDLSLHYSHEYFQVPTKYCLIKRDSFLYDMLRLTMDKFIFAKFDHNSIYHHSNADKLEQLSLNIARRHKNWVINPNPTVVSQKQHTIKLVGSGKENIDPAKKSLKRKLPLQDEKIRPTKKVSKLLGKLFPPWDDDEYFP